MKRRLPAAFAALLLLAAITACAKDNTKTGYIAKPQDAAEETEYGWAPESGDGDETENEEVSGPEFSLLADGQTLTLQQPAGKILPELSFAVISDDWSNSQVYEASDYTIPVRTVVYDGLEIKLIAMGDSNNCVARMIAATDKVRTNRGVSVGDPVDKVLHNYPEAEAHGDSYIVADFDADPANKLTFTISGGAVEEIMLATFPFVAVETVTPQPSAAPQRPENESPAGSPTPSPAPEAVQEPDLSRYTGPLGGYDKIAMMGASASSEVTWDGIYYSAEAAIDSDFSTSWQEDAEGKGIGEYIVIYFDGAADISLIYLRPGFAKTEDSYINNAKPSALLFEFSDGTSLRYSLPELNEDIYLSTGAPVSSSYMKITILDAYEGEKYTDTAISEIAAYSEAS